MDDIRYVYILDTVMSLTEFVKACMDGDMDVINSVIKDSKLDKYITDSGKIKSNYLDSGLKGACKSGHVDVIKLLIEHEANDWNGGLYGACEGGHLDIINLMIKHGADDWNGGLEGACSGGHLNIANLMIEHGAKYWQWGLESACKEGHLDIVNLMIERGSKPINYYGTLYSVIDFNRGLYNASLGGHLEIADLMIKKGANRLDLGINAAWKEGHSNIIKLMIEHGFDDWEFILYHAFNLIDSNIISLMTKKKILLKKYLKYPRDKTKIFKLYELGLPKRNFNDIEGSTELIIDMKKRRNTVKHILSDHLIVDLIGVLNKYIIN